MNSQAARSPGAPRLPASLSTREGWADYFEARLTAEPHLHQIEPTNCCPYSCVMCPRPTRMTRPTGFMEMELFRRVIDEVAAYGEPVRSREIELFHFGESLLHPEFPEMVGYVSGKGLRSQISTKAFLISPDLTERILKNRPGRLIISLDGYDAESCRRIVGPAADFDAAVHNVEHLIREHERTGSATGILLRLIRIRENREAAEEFRRRWAEKGIRVELRTFFPWGEPDLADVGEFDRYPPKMPCPFPWQYLVVQWNGDVVPCCRDYNATNVVGNVRKATLRDIWHGDALGRVRDQLRTGDYADNGTCRKCMSLYYTEEAPAERRAPARIGPDSEPALTPSGREALNAVGPDAPASSDREILYWLGHQPDLRALAGLLSLDVEDLCERLGALRELGLVRAKENAPLDELEISPVPPVDRDDLAGVWRTAVSAHGDRPCLIDDADGGVCSYADADRIVSALMHRLRAEGVSRGDRVAVWTPLHMEAVLLFWAAVQVGAVVVPLDPALPAEAAGELLPRVSPSLLLVDSARFGRLPPGSFRAVLVDENTPPPSGAVTLSKWFSDEDLERDRAAPDRQLACEPAAIVFTSGTTGRQKGVVLDHGALANSGRIMARSYEWSPRDVLLSTGDLHTMSGLRNPTVATACAGSAAVVPAAESRRGPLAVADCANRHGVTLLTTVPAALRGLLEAADRLQPGSLRALRAVLSTAARLPEELRASFEGRFRVPVLDYYGLTETAGFCAGRLPRSGSCAIASIGRPVDALFRLVDENGVDAAEGSSGELWIQSANLTSGYLDDPEATGASFSGRWYRTGDLAVRNPDGSYSLVGRLREIIKNAHGEIVAPAEIEDALMSHPGVVDAGACAVSGGDGREKLLAFAVPQSGSGGDADAERLSVELRRYLLARLGPKRAPADVFVRKSLPRNSNGKLKAAELLSEVGSR